MLRQQSSRNQRAKGFRVKHFLQIFLLVAVCIWLLYQVKHSHDKRKAFEEKSSKVLGKVVESEPNNFRLGRKDLPRTTETDSLTETRDDEEEKEEDKEEVEDEEEPKQEETEDEEGRGIIDDELDEQDQFGANEEAAQGEELADDENEGKDMEADIFDEEDHERNTQEAREENYQGDDAASAVHRDTEATESEFGNVGLRSSDDEHTENLWKDNGEVENTLNSTVDESKAGDTVMEIVEDLKANDLSGQNETLPTDNPSLNSTIVKESVDESLSNTTAVESNNLTELQNNFTTESDGHIELQRNSTPIVEDQKEPMVNSSAVDVISGGEKLQNETDSLGSLQGQNSTANVGHAEAVEENTNTENALTDEKVDTTAAQEGTKEASIVSSATNDNGEKVQTM